MRIDVGNKFRSVVDRAYVPPFSTVVSARIFRYGVCGGVNMVLDAVWYFIIYHFLVCGRFTDLGFVVVSPHIMSLAIVFPITFLNGFWLNRNVVFGSGEAGVAGQMGRYAVTVGGSILLNYVVMKLLVEVAMIWPTPSKLITTAVCAVYSYLVGRYYTFRVR